MVQVNKDVWDRNVAKISVMIEYEGLPNVLRAVSEALKTLEEDYILYNEDFYETSEGIDLVHCRDIVEHAVRACDLKLTKERFSESVDPEYKKIALYEKLRRLNPREYTELYRRAILGEGTFDELLELWP